MKKKASKGLSQIRQSLINSFLYLRVHSFLLENSHPPTPTSPELAFSSSSKDRIILSWNKGKKAKKIKYQVQRIQIFWLDMMMLSKISCYRYWTGLVHAAAKGKRKLESRGKKMQPLYEKTQHHQIALICMYVALIAMINMYVYVCVCEKRFSKIFFVRSGRCI